MQRWVWCETCKKWEARDEVINLSDVIQMDSICLPNKGAINNMSEHQFLLWGWALGSRERAHIKWEESKSLIKTLAVWPQTAQKKEHGVGLVCSPRKGSCEQDPKVNPTLSGL